MNSIIRYFVIVTFSLMFSPGNGSATLWDRGGGLIYDDVLDVTWLQDASYADTTGFAEKLNWGGAVDWVSGLEYEDSIRGTTWDDWRLPSTVNDRSSLGYDTTGQSGELAYMYYVNLGYSPNSSHDRFDPAPTSDNYNPFVHLHYRGYWSGTITEFSDQAWMLHFHFGSVEWNGIGDEQRVWALRDGDVADIPEGNDVAGIPEPSTYWLMATGLILLAASSKLKKDNK